ncbi:hypothetical protein [Zavarzinella formosa]|uniref:hypothetical protein n=1 Tax=Zavarzinella formosa TaxID=360055 RepID=UPI000317C1A6|nr:hypothetical protein [Zavarzinella formosa]
MSNKRLLGFETKHQPVISRRAFLNRMGRNLGAAFLFIAVSLSAGMCGYHFLEDMAWIDSFANASMILSGMGPLAPMNTYGGKLFAGFYALYSGLAVILIAGLILAPVLHRVLHRFHVEMDKN